MRKENKNLEKGQETTLLNPKIEIAYDFNHPLDFSSFKITSTYEEKSNKEDININFDQIDEYISRLVKYIKNINNELTKIMTKLTKMKSVVKDPKRIETIIKSCKKKIALNEKKIEKLQNSIHMDTKDFIISGQKQQQELIKKVTELEQLMAAQIVFNNNIQEQFKKN